MSPRRIKQSAIEYLAGWYKLIDATADPHTLLQRWWKERDQRDDLKVPVAQRLDLLRSIAPEEVNDGPPPP
jgi:hypothetical protein